MQTSILTFPAHRSAPRTIIRSKKVLHRATPRAAKVNVSAAVDSFIKYPSYVSVVDNNCPEPSSLQRMEAVYERVTAFLQKMQDDDFRV